MTARTIGYLAFGLTLICVTGSAQTADSPRTKPIHHYVFFGGNREQIRTLRAFLDNAQFEGAQIIYPWRSLEPGKDEYDFGAIRDDLAFLKSKNKKLWIQLQDVTFDSLHINVPRYLLKDSTYHGGAAKQYSIRGGDESKAATAGWVARRWDPAVQARFQKLLLALGKEFDGKIEGINLPETSLDFGESGRLFPSGFSVADYPDAIIANIKALKIAFPKSIALQYANFMPGEWRPTDNKGYLDRVYKSARSLGVGVGGPDLLPFRPGQTKGAYPLIRDAAMSIPTGIAVQDGNLEAVNPVTHKKVTAQELLDFAMNDLKVDYIFWGTQEPYFSDEVVPTVTQGSRRSQ
jgi:hypothetical protein